MNLPRGILLLTAVLSCGGSPTPPSGACSFVGTWKETVPVANGDTWTANADGTYSVAVNGGAAQGVWGVSGNTITTHDTSGTLACPSSQVATYNIAFASSCNQFSMTALNDPCSGRKSILDGSTFARQ